MKGIVSSIEIAAEEGGALVSLDSVKAVAGQGLEGDRNFFDASSNPAEEHNPDKEITLIEMECIEEFNRNYQMEYTSADIRRNIATRGIRLNDLNGREFRIGEVRLKGHRLCEPCNYLAGRTTPKILEGLAHKAGLRAEILEGGIIRVGDTIELIEEGNGEG